MLVGRKREREMLSALVARARQGQGAALLVMGEPGIGKTTLLDATARQHGNGTTVLRTACRAPDADLPFAALADLLAPVQHQFRGLPHPQSLALRRALGLAGGTGSVHGPSVGVATLGVLAVLARHRPVLVVVDDLQLADEPSRATVLFAARRLEQLRVAMLLGAREGHLPENEISALPRLELGGLRPADARTLLATTAGGGVDPVVRRRLLELSAGNPLALVELPVGLSDGQLSGDEPLGEPIPVNGGIERAFGTRVARLSGRTREALLIAAAADSDQGGAVLAALRRSELDLADLEPAVQDGLVAVVDGRVEFRHPLVRSVVYHGQPEEARRAAHRRLAGVEQDADRQAWHAYAAAEGPDDSVAGNLDAAAFRALARGAPATAARAFEAASRITQNAEARGRRLTGAARAAHRAGDVAGAERYSAAARELTSDPVANADLLLVESDLRMRAGDLEGAHRALLDQSEKLVAIDRRRAATMLLLAAKLRIYRLEAAAAAEEVDRALAILPAGEHELVHLVAMSMSETAAGRSGARRAALAAAAAAAEAPHGHAHTLGIAWPLIWLEEYEAAREVASRALAIQREAGFLLYLPQTLLPLAELDFRTGRWETAIASAREALELFRETHQPTEAASAAAVLARIEAARGNSASCHALAEAALAGDVEFGLRSSSAHALAALGFLALGSRRPEEAAVSLETAERIATRGAVGEPWLLLSTPDLVEALVHAGQTARAVEVLSAFEERCAATGRVSASAAAARCRGMLGDMEAFERALELHARVPTPFERARTELCFAESLRRAKRRAEAREQLRAALGTFEALGATPWAERARAELRASGQTRRRTTPLDSLTAQERVVATLVSQGAKNREAAATLFVSEKTVEFHLANVYRKLGVRSRVELTRTLGTS